MSRAVVTWSSSGRPEALRKVVADMPSWRALLGHQPGEFLLAAGDVLGHGDGHVVGALGDQDLDGIDESDLLALVEVELGGGRGSGVGRELDLGLVAEPALLDQLEGQVDGHHLGERGGVARLVGGALVQHAAGVGIDDQHGALGLAAACAARATAAAGPHRRPRASRDATPTPRPRHSILNRHSLSVQRRRPCPCTLGVDALSNWAAPLWGVFEAPSSLRGRSPVGDKRSDSR